MSKEVLDLKCPGCGAPAQMGESVCRFCGRPIIISTFQSVYTMPMPELNKYAGAYRQALGKNPENPELNRSAAMCYLKLRLYDKALEAFEKAVETDFDHSETFFYAAVCLLKGNRPFMMNKSVIEKIEEYIRAAVMIEPRGIYYYFLSYVKYDYYFCKRLNVSPGYQETLQQALQAGLSVYDVEQLYAILGTQKPACL